MIRRKRLRPILTCPRSCRHRHRTSLLICLSNQEGSLTYGLTLARGRVMRCGTVFKDNPRHPRPPKTAAAVNAGARKACAPALRTAVAAAKVALALNVPIRIRPWAPARLSPSPSPENGPYAAEDSRPTMLTPPLTPAPTLSRQVPPRVRL